MLIVVVWKNLWVIVERKKKRFKWRVMESEGLSCVVNYEEIEVRSRSLV